MQNKKSIIMIIMCIAVFVMAVGYAVFSTNLNIDAVGNISATWGISITNITSTITGTATNISDPTYTDVNATFHAGLKKPGDKITYAITVSNTGNIDAIITDVIINTSGASEVIYSVENLDKNQKLSKKSSITFNLITEFDRNATSIPALSSKQINISIVVVQDDGTSPTPIAPEITDITTQYGIMYVANGGSGLMEGTVCIIGQSCELRTNSFFKEGYKFKGWSTTPTGNVEYNDGQSVYDLTTKGKTKTLYAVWLKTTLLNMILIDNAAQPDTGIDFSKTSEVTGTNGLYYTSTNTENNGTTYYFRGNVENNYVRIYKEEKTCMYDGHEVMLVEGYFDPQNGPQIIDKGKITSEDECLSTIVCYGQVGNSPYEYTVGQTENDCGYWGATPMGEATYEESYIDWRIVRINEDGSIRVVTQDIVGKSTFNENNSDNAHVGYMYGATGQTGTNGYKLTHSNDNPSTIKTYLDEWYTLNLSGFSNEISHEAGFCNDRSVASSAGSWYSDDTALGYGTETTIYGAAGRLTKDYEIKTVAQLQFKCPNEERDLFTPNTSINGNKKLTNPIGLLTIDDVVFAGSIYGDANENMYLYNGVEYWTMSPFEFAIDGVYMWFINSDGYVDVNTANGSGGVRPVINLKSTVILSNDILSGCTEQNGTQACPYIIKSN